ncbi:hypothetical protein Holit_01613 [Hollandina sp. SP2]
MPRPPKPFTTPRRSDYKTFQITLNPSCGLSSAICNQWKRRSFQDFPPELAQYRYPKTKSAAFALIEYLKKADEPVRILTDTILIGAWLKKFTCIEGNPRSARNIAKNRPYSVNTITRYEGHYRIYIKDDPFAKIPIYEAEESDALEFISRLAQKNMDRFNYKNKKLVGTNTLEKIVKFLRMAFKEYQKTHPKWHNPFRDIDPPQNTQKGNRDVLLLKMR